MDQFLVFIASSLVLVPIFQKLGFGSVLGYLTAGILVGPFGLGLITESHGVLHFAELGVVLLLFMIGLEIQPSKLKSMRGQLLGLGGLQVVITTLVLTGIGLWVGWSLTTAGVIGFSLSLSSTAFAIQTLTEKNEFNTEFGQSSFSVLLMQDLIAIPALAVIPVLGVATKGGPTLFDTFIYVPVIVISLVFASRFLIRPLFRMIASTRSREMFTAVTLFIVLGVAALMQKIGLSAALGTFMAGVLLADSEYRHELETNLEPFKGLLMGLFFIAVGMGVNLELIVSRPFFLFGVTIGYLFIKWLVLYGVGRLYKLNHENSKLMGISIAQGGEFAFVIFGIATTAQLADAQTIELLTVVITISMAMSPLLSMANDWWVSRNTVVDEPKYDEIKNEAPKVIIAGLGRFGQIFGRVLKMQGISFVAIDHDPDNIELLRKFGFKVYYGDASRLDLLEAAGAQKATFLILAIDDVEASLKTVKLVQDHFPHLKIFARARNRGHYFDLLEEKVHKVKRETFDSSVNFVKDLLIDMGFDKERATGVIERFKRHDEVMIREQFKVRKDDKAYISVSNQAIEQLNQVLQDESTHTYIDLSPK